jgi:ABC-type glycerol-3-phosphate transport system permease component
MKLQTRDRLQKRFNLFLGYFILITVTIAISLPIVTLIIGSVKQDSELVAYPIRIFPKVAQWANYVQVFILTPFVKVAWRTFLLGFATTTIVTFVSSMVGFAFARYQAPGSGKLFSIVIALLIVPGIVTIIPQFLLYSRLHLTNTYWPWILGALGGSPFYIFLFRQFFLSFPKELEEAAEVDGATAFRIFWQIFLPNAKPVLATVMFFAFFGVWSDYLTPLIYLNDNNTLLGVKMATAFKNPKGVDLTTVSFAADIYYILPMVIVFFLAQRHILKGVITSGLKG